MEKLTLAERMERSLRNARERGYYGPKTATEAQEQERALEQARRWEREQAALADARAAIAGAYAVPRLMEGRSSEELRNQHLSSYYDRIAKIPPSRSWFDSAVRATAGKIASDEVIQMAQRDQVVCDEVFKDAMVTGTGARLFRLTGVRRYLDELRAAREFIQKSQRIQVHEMFRECRIGRVRASVEHQKAMARRYFAGLNERMREVMK